MQAGSRHLTFTLEIRILSTLTVDVIPCIPLHGCPWSSQSSSPEHGGEGDRDVRGVSGAYPPPPLLHLLRNESSPPSTLLPGAKDGICVVVHSVVHKYSVIPYLTGSMGRGEKLSTCLDKHHHFPQCHTHIQKDTQTIDKQTHGPSMATTSNELLEERVGSIEQEIAEGIGIQLYCLVHAKFSRSHLSNEIVSLFSDFFLSSVVVCVSLRVLLG